MPKKAPSFAKWLSDKEYSSNKKVESARYIQAAGFVADWACWRCSRKGIECVVKEKERVHGVLTKCAWCTASGEGGCNAAVATGDDTEEEEEEEEEKEEEEKKKGEEGNSVKGEHVGKDREAQCEIQDLNEVKEDGVEVVDYGWFTEINEQLEAAMILINLFEMEKLLTAIALLEHFSSKGVVFEPNA